MLEVDSRIRGLSQVEESCPRGIIGAPRRAAPAVSMNQCLEAAVSIRSAEPTHLANRQVQEISGFRHAQLSTVQGVQDGQLLLRAVRQSNHPPRIRLGGGRTFSLSS